ncbi:MAG: hypothetical protein ACK5CV_08180 [Bacteroidota bacterium]|jgi:hypothetical protein
METLICPYPGLRPFAEDESIFFKGRDAHTAKAVSLLEQNRFLMITGASGDGKSSLTYAGLIPRARAGFFKARFNSWLLADFTPSRSPLQMLSKAVASALKMQEEQVKAKLQHGFSALLQLYAESGFFIDTQSTEYQQADEQGKKNLEKKGANLIILADQFEEFFTNPENFSHGVPSDEAQLVMNLLIESARISQSQSLPVYVVCTMRSDYIGQCAAFRGLPEMIGFSQFFVPRLKRKELQQVIAEPAKLAGGAITPRLTETLVNAIGSGFDQLPVLQHALNQLWQLSYGEGGTQKPIDIPSLVKLAGAPLDFLDETDKLEFEKWLELQTEQNRKYFLRPSLENVLNAHAGELYEKTLEEVRSNYADMPWISRSEHILNTLLQCMVKADAGRYVRNRMTAEEIVGIIDEKDFTIEHVAVFVAHFRKQGNTLIKPYDNEQSVLLAESLLDISHESLIRNWERLQELSRQEYDDRMVYADFLVQMQRWYANNKDSGYLLPIGSLNYFEQWFSQKRPSAGWLLKYDESGEDKQTKKIQFDKELKEAQVFIKASARNLMFNRFVLKYGANRLLMHVGVVLVICSCIYFYLDWYAKQNEQVIKRVMAFNLENLNNPYISEKKKAAFLIEYSRFNRDSADAGMFIDAIRNMEDSTQITIVREAINWCLLKDADTASYCRDLPFLKKLADHGFSSLRKITEEQIQSIEKGEAQQINTLHAHLFTKVLLWLSAAGVPGMDELKEKTHSINEQLMMAVIRYKEKNPKKVFLEKISLNPLFAANSLLSPEHPLLFAYFNTHGDVPALLDKCRKLYDADKAEAAPLGFVNNGFFIPQILFFQQQEYASQKAFQKTFQNEKDFNQSGKLKTIDDLVLFGTLLANKNADASETWKAILRFCEKEDRIRNLAVKILYYSVQEILAGLEIQKRFPPMCQYFLPTKAVKAAYENLTSSVNKRGLNSEQQKLLLAHYEKKYAAFLHHAGDTAGEKKAIRKAWHQFYLIKDKNSSIGTATKLSGNDFMYSMPGKYAGSFMGGENPFEGNIYLSYWDEKTTSEVPWPQSGIYENKEGFYEEADASDTLHLTEETLKEIQGSWFDKDFFESGPVFARVFNKMLKKSFLPAELAKTNYFDLVSLVTSKQAQAKKIHIHIPAENRYFSLMNIPALCRSLILKGYPVEVAMFLDSSSMQLIAQEDLLMLCETFIDKGYEEHALPLLQHIYKKENHLLDKLQRKYLRSLALIGGINGEKFAGRISSNTAGSNEDYKYNYFSGLVDRGALFDAEQLLGGSEINGMRFWLNTWMLMRSNNNNNNTLFMPARKTFEIGYYNYQNTVTIR